MSAQHTPGPWQQNRQSVLIPIAPYEWAEAYGGSEANARLIAAAPDLLAALEVCIARSSLDGDPWAREKVLAAIAAATGAQP